MGWKGEATVETQLSPMLREGNQPQWMAETKKERKKENSKVKLNSHLSSCLGCRENVTLFSKLLPCSVYLRQTSPVASADYKLEKGRNDRRMRSSKERVELGQLLNSTH